MENFSKLVKSNQLDKRPDSDKCGEHVTNILNNEDEFRPKTFNFGPQFFDSKLPTSPNRKILLSEFLKKRLGEETF